MSQQHAIVTDLCSDIGFAIATRLLARGWIVGGIGSDVERLAELAFEGGRNFFGLDDLLPGPLQRTQLLANFPRTDLLINVACASSPRRGSSWSTARESELVACLELAHALTPSLQRTSSPTLINVSCTACPPSSVAGIANYARFKTALERAADALRIELAPHGIRVINIATALPDGRLGGVSAHDIADTIEWMTLRPAHAHVNDISLFTPVSSPAPAPRARVIELQPGLSDR